MVFRYLGLGFSPVASDQQGGSSGPLSISEIIFCVQFMSALWFLMFKYEQIMLTLQAIQINNKNGFYSQ